MRSALIALLVIIGILNCALFWPGQMSPDSHSQYQAALTATYSDHHPPIMSVVWRFLDTIVPGSGLLFFVHMIMLYAAAIIIVMCHTNPIAARFALLIPCAPPIILYSSLLWKDVGFACAYTLALALICYCIMHRTRPPPLITTTIMTLLFYGTAIKFQAHAALPIALLGLSYCLTRFSVSLRTIVLTIALSIATLSGITLFNRLYVPLESKSHSWQLVKLYDLAGMSILENQSLLPQFITEYHLFSNDAVEQKYNHERVDDLTGFTDSPLRMGINEHERTQLLHTWQQAVYKHPCLYLQHRFSVWWRTVTIKPLEKLNTLDFSQYQGLRWFCAMQNTQESNTCFSLLSTLLLELLSAVRYASTLLIWLPFLIGYFVLGLCMLSKSKAAMPLVILNGIGIMFLTVLFFCSMASAIRYILIVFCMIHASHSFAYVCITDLVGRLNNDA